MPTGNLTERQAPVSQSVFLLDLATLKLRARRGHDLRRTFMTLAQVDGARRDLLEAVTHGPEPAQRYRYLDGQGEFGVIPSVTKPFCASCDRVRLTAEGQFRSCLFALRERDLRTILRSGGTDDDLAAAIEAEVGTKWAGHSIGRVEFIRPARTMSQIGG